MPSNRHPEALFAEGSSFQILRSAQDDVDSSNFLKFIEKKLSGGGIASFRAEAERLIFHFGGFERIDFYTGTRALTIGQKKKVENAVRKRISGVPLTYLMGRAGFYGRDFIVNRHVLVPRPETEILVEKALDILRKKRVSGRRILDVGTGSGCIAVSLTLESPDCTMSALDKSFQALKIAKKNADLYKLGNRILFYQSNLFEVFGPKRRGYWDMIVSNPPYISREELRHLPPDVKNEPRLALEGGIRGSEIIEKIIVRAPYFLKKGGHLLIEMGEGQAGRIAQKVSSLKTYKGLEFIKDLNGIDRLVVLKI